MADTNYALGFGGNNNNSGSHSPIVGTYSGGNHAPWGMNDTAHPVELTGAGGYSGPGGGFFALAMTLAQSAITFQQLQLAQNYYNTNKKDFDFFRNTYQARLVAHKDQAFAAPFYVQDYNVSVGGALEHTKVYDEKWLQSRRRAHRYAVGHQQHIDYTYYMMRRRAAMSAYLMGRRVEDARKDWKDDQIQTHKVQALNFGIAVGNIARQGLAQAVGTKEKALDELGSRVGGFANGAAERNGYVQGRNAGSKGLNDSSSSGSAMAAHTVRSSQ